MPVLSYLDFLESAVSNSGALVVTRNGLRLRRLNAGGEFDPTALLPAAGEYATLPNLAGTGITSLWGFMVQGELGGTDDVPGIVDCQLSEDDGVTWRYWDGAAWSAAGAGNWSLPSVVRTNITTFPLGGGPVRGVRLRLRLRPDTTRKHSPEIRDAWFLAEFDHDPVVDVLRSVRSYLAALRVPLYARETATGAGTILLTPFDYTVDAALGIEVYNVTDDPGCQTDLFQAYNAGTGVVTLTAAQDVGDTLEIHFHGFPPVVLTPSAWFHDSRVPSVEVSVSAALDEAQSGGVDLEINEDARIARTRFGPRYLACALTVTCVDKDQERAALLASRVRRALHETNVVSRATAQVWPVADVAGFDPIVQLSDSLFTPKVTANLWVREDYTAFTQDSLAVAINLRISTLPEDQWQTRVHYDETMSVIPT